MSRNQMRTCWYIGLILHLIIFLQSQNASAGDVMLAWDAPITNTDGSALDDLAGYKVHYGTSSQTYSQFIDVGNATSYQVTSLTDGLTYYFSVIAYDATGNESIHSGEISTTINPPPPPEPDITITDSAGPDNDLQVPFADLTEGESTSETITLTNDGNAALTAGTIAQIDQISAPFSISDDTCSGQTIMPAESCTFTIEFSPSVPGQFNDTIDIPSDDPDENPVIMSLSGTSLTNSAPAADPGGPYTITEGQVLALDGSASNDQNGTITQYEWDINNDGTYDYISPSPAQNHLYANNGAATITLKVTDNLGKTGVTSTTVIISDTAPTAQFSANPLQGAAPLTVNFSNSATGYDQPLTFEWDFDNDGIADSAVATPAHTYTSEGTYTVKLTTTDSDGTINSITNTAYVAVSPPVFTATVSLNGNGTVTSSPSGINCGIDCSDLFEEGSVVTLTAAPQNGHHLESWTGCDSSGNSQCIVTMGADTAVSVTFVASELSLVCNDGGSILCLERADGGDDSTNLDGGSPKTDLEYNFRITVKDSSGSTPDYVRLFMTQRSSPGADDFFSHDMACGTDFVTGAPCSTTLKLGPAAVHKFYFESMMGDGSVLRYPGSGSITGPEIQLLTGLNIVGIPRNLASVQMDSFMAFDSSVAHRWNPDLGYYLDISDSEPAVTGEGYFVERQSAVLPEHGGHGDLSDPEFAYELKPGWNLISNPYSGHVLIEDIKLRKGSSTPITWADAAAASWLTNAIYYFKGTDWGDTYGFESGTGASVVPWSGYWLHLNMSDDVYYLMIPKP